MWRMSMTGPSFEGKSAPVRRIESHDAVFVVGKGMNAGMDISPPRMGVGAAG